MPALDQYAPTDDLAYRVGHLMGDQEIIEAGHRRKVAIDVPPTLTDRVLDRVKKVLRPKVKQPKVEGLGQPAQKIADGQRRKGLFE